MNTLTPDNTEDVSDDERVIYEDLLIAIEKESATITRAKASEIEQQETKTFRDTSFGNAYESLYPEVFQQLLEKYGMLHYFKVK